jgi:hypothetical protein
MKLKDKILRFSLLALLSLLSLSVQAEEQETQHKCLLIYSLSGPSQTFFSQQVEQLKMQLLRKDIALMDLNSWYPEPPYIALSGRQKSLLRTSYDLPHQGNAAVLLDKNDQLIVRYQGTVDLVNILLACH